MKIIQSLSDSTLYSASEQAVVDFILTHKETVLDLSIQKLALLTYTSNPTILRVCRKCGARGYKDFKLKLAQELEKLNFDINQINVNQPFKKKDNYKKIAGQLGELYRESTQRTYALLNEEMLDVATELIKNAERIYLYAYGDSLIQAMNFRNKLIKLNKNAIIAMEHQQQLFHSYNIGDKDCAMFVTYRGTPKFVTIAKTISAKNVPIICITANSSSLIAKYADIVIPVAKNEDEFSKIASFASQIELEYIFNILFSCLFEKNYDFYDTYKNAAMSLVLMNENIID